MAAEYGMITSKWIMRNTRTALGPPCAQVGRLPILCCNEFIRLVNASTLTIIVYHLYGDLAITIINRDLHLFAAALLFHRPFNIPSG